MLKTLFLLTALQVPGLLNAQTTIPLYDQSIPNSKLGVSKAVEPTLTIYSPEKGQARGVSVIIFPGGGYSNVVIKKEGDDVAKWFVSWGVTAFVVKYRLPNDTTMIKKEIGPLQDAQRAIQLVRSHAEEWNIDPDKVGIIGFSAGGHLASTLGTHFKKAVIPNEQHVSLRPDFMVLVYPVISLTDSLAHKGSRTRLLGDNPSNSLVKKFSNEFNVTKKTPPTFLVHGKDDKVVKVENSIAFYNALRKKKVPAEIHLYEKGTHGFALNNTASNEKWTDWLKTWMNSLF